MSLGTSFLDQVNQAFDRAAGFTHHQPTLLANIKALQEPLLHQLPHQARRRHHRGDSRLAGRAQPPQAPQQGRHPLRARGRRRRGEGARRAHDLQVRPGGRAVRRRQGRDPDRPQDLLGRASWSGSPGATCSSWCARTSSARASTCRRPTSAPARARWPGSPTPTPSSARASSTRSAASPASRSARAASAAGPRPPAAASSTATREVCGVAEDMKALGLSPGHRGQAGRHPGARQRRLLRRQVLPGGGRDPRRARRARGGDRQPEGARPRGRSWRTGAERQSLLGFPGGTDLPRRGGRARARLRHPDPGGARAPDHRRERAADQGARSSSRPPTARPPARPTRS